MINCTIQRSAFIASSSLSRLYKKDPRSSFSIAGITPRSALILQQGRSGSSLACTVDCSSSAFRTKKSREAKCHSLEVRNVQKRSLNVTHQYANQLDEELRHVELSQVSTALQVEQRRKTVVPRKKSLIQGVGIEGAKNAQRLKSSTEDKIELETNPTDAASLWVAPAFDSDLIVVLDMDECLIHAQFLGKQDQESEWQSSSTDTYRQYEADRQYSSSDSNKSDRDTARCESFKISLPDGELVRVNKRPHLTTFLNQVCSSFETYIFTAAMPVYACPVLDKLDPKKHMIQGRFYRESCSLDSELGVYVKDLQTVLTNRNDRHEQQKRHLQELTNGNEDRIVLIDNNPLSFLANPSNGILVSNFYDDPNDQTLLSVLDLLMDLGKKNGDVRPQLNSMFGLKDALNEVIRNN